VAAGTRSLLFGTVPVIAGVAVFSCARQILAAHAGFVARYPGWARSAYKVLSLGIDVTRVTPGLVVWAHIMALGLVLFGFFIIGVSLWVPTDLTPSR
jgi:hypothetical protein